MVSGPEKILTETENLSQGAEAQYSLSQSFFGSGDREVEFTGLKNFKDEIIEVDFVRKIQEPEPRLVVNPVNLVSFLRKMNSDD